MMGAIIINPPPDIDLTAHVQSLMLFKDDVDAQEFLVRNEVMAAMPRPQKKSHGTSAALIFGDHPSHWIISIHWEDYREKDKNGWLVICDPKAISTYKQTRERLMNTIKGSDIYAEDIKTSWKAGKN